MLRSTTYSRNKRLQKRGRGYVGLSLPIPAYPIVANARLWLNWRTNLFTDVTGTVPAVMTNSIASWRAVGESWSNDLETQSGSNFRPALAADGIRFDGVNDRLSLVTMTFTGPFTVYAVYYDTGTGRLGLIGNSSNFTGIDSLSTEIRLTTTAGTVGKIVSSAPATPTLRLLRIRRDSSNNIFIGASGVAEGAATTNDSSSITFNQLGQVLVFMANDKYLRQIVTVAADTVTAGTNAAIVAKLQSLEPGLENIPDTLPAPTDLQIVYDSVESKYVLTWTDGGGDVTGWKIYHDGVEEDTSLITSYETNTASEGEEFYVTAYNAYGDSLPSNTVTVPAPEIPDPPTGLGYSLVTPGDPNEYELTWNTSDAFGWKIFQNGMEVFTSGSNSYVTFAQIGDEFYIVAYNGVGDSLPSETVTIE
jgi:hypothetical protein